MEVMQAILTRRSIRKFSGEPLPEETLQILLEAGFAAPSASNRRPQHFVIIRDEQKLQQIPRVQPFTRWLPQAGCAIVVCGDLRRQPLKGFLAQDCAASIQNMLLAAHGLGLGAVWGGLYPVKAFTRGIRRLLHLPPWMIPVGLIGVGPTHDEKPARRIFDQERVFQEHM